MKPLPILLDTNLLLLLVVGMTNKTYIAKHKRLQAFTVEDYEVLGSILAGAPSVLLLPNTITETSNLAANIADPARTETFFTFKRLIQATSEQYVESRVASERLEYLRLGLTDAAILEALADEVAVHDRSGAGRRGTGQGASGAELQPHTGRVPDLTSSSVSTRLVWPNARRRSERLGGRAPLRASPLRPEQTGGALFAAK